MENQSENNNHEQQNVHPQPSPSQSNNTQPQHTAQPQVEYPPQASQPLQTPQPQGEYPSHLNNAQPQYTPQPQGGYPPQANYTQPPVYTPQPQEGFSQHAAGVQHHQQSRPKRRFRNGVKTILTTVTLIRSLLVVILLLFLITLVGTMMGDADLAIPPNEANFSVIRIEGVITGSRSVGESGYDHQATMEYIRNLSTNSLDRGILLYMNTPGGTVYHSDELYLALLEYKEITGRPIYAFMAEMCASGGYYISMAADHIMANRITLTGSLGVVSVLLDTSELFEIIGLRTVVLDSGEHKATGTMGTEITPNQAAVYQSFIDESYDLFVSLIAEGRGMSEQTVRELADGRIYTALQALELGLIDEIGNWEIALADFGELTGAIPYYPSLYIQPTFWDGVLVRLSRTNSMSETDFALMRLSELPSGVPLAIAMELVQS